MGYDHIMVCIFVSLLPIFIKFQQKFNAHRTLTIKEFVKVRICWVVEVEVLRLIKGDALSHDSLVLFLHPAKRTLSLPRGPCLGGFYISQTPKYRMFSVFLSKSVSRCLCLCPSVFLWFDNQLNEEELQERVTWAEMDPLDQGRGRKPQPLSWEMRESGSDYNFRKSLPSRIIANTMIPVIMA